MLYLTIVAVLVAGSSCIPRAVRPNLKPEEIPDFAFQNLKRQRSFAFDYRLEQQEPVAVRQSAAGVYILPDQEEVKGTWSYGGHNGAVVPFHLVGSGDKEYEKTDSSWAVHSRGEETDLLVQVDRARLRAKYKLLKEKPDYEFEFTPNTPFLDPTLTKKVKGMLVVNRQMLPRKISAWLDNGAASWQVDFKNYNQPDQVNLPFVRQKKVVFAAADPRPVLEPLRQRFVTMGLDVRMTVKDAAIEAVFAREVDDGLLASLIQPGRVEIAPLRWMESAGDSTPTVSSAGGRILAYQDRTVAVSPAVLTNRDLSGARINFDPLGRPVLEVIPNAAGTDIYLALSKANLKRHLGVLIDGRIVTVNYIDKIPPSAIIAITDLPMYKDALILQALINSGILSHTVTRSEKGE